MSLEKEWKGSCWGGPCPAREVWGQLGEWWKVWPLLAGRNVSAEDVHTWYDGRPEPPLEPDRKWSPWLPEAPEPR